MPLSRNVLLSPSAPKFTLDRGEDPRGRTHAERHAPYVLRRDPEATRKSAVIEADPLRLAKSADQWARIDLQIGTSGEGSQYSRSFKMSRENNAETVIPIRQGSIAQRIKDLRRSLRLNQTEFGQLCGVRQVSVSQWESDVAERRALPTAKALIKMSELAQEIDRRWWRDRAAEQAGFEGNNTFEILQPVNPITTIPLVSDPAKVTELGSISSPYVERTLSFPTEWFPEGGVIRAVRIASAATADLLAMVDITHRDPDRLVGRMVATRAAHGIEARWLGVDGSAFILLPFAPGQAPKILQAEGEYSMVGEIRWIGHSIVPTPVPTRRRRRG